MNEYEFEPTEHSEAEYAIQPSEPPIVGYWVMGHLWIGMRKKPRWFTRLAMKLVFETKWSDGPVTAPS